MFLCMCEMTRKWLTFLQFARFIMENILYESPGLEEMCIKE